MFGSDLPRLSPEWAAWANGVAVRELDYHDTFLAAEYSHPGDNIPPILARRPARSAAAAPSCVRGIATGYEIQIDLVKAISLHKHKIDHVAHLGPSAAAGIGTLLGLPVETIFQAIGQALHTTTATRQSRKGEISTLEGARPGLRRQDGGRGRRPRDARPDQPHPDLRGRGRRDRLAARRPGCRTTRFRCPAQARPKRGILDTYTKEHSAEYQAQAWIDLARKLQHEHPELTADTIASVVLHTSHHTHYVIGSGANDPQKYDPSASRETLDHSIPYIFTVALQDGEWHHERSYAPERADRARHRRAVAQGHHRRRTRSGRAATTPTTRPRRRSAAASRSPSPTARRIVDEIAVADAHPLGARPFAREQYVHKFRTLADGGARGRPRSSDSSTPRSDLPNSPPTSSTGSPSRRSRPLARPSAPKGLF